MKKAKKDTFDSLVEKAKKLSELLNCDVNFTIKYKTIHNKGVTKVVISFSFSYFHTCTLDILKIKNEISEILETNNWTLSTENLGILSTIHYINTLIEVE